MMIGSNELIRGLVLVTVYVQVLGSGVFEFEVVTFHNDLGLDETGTHCCEGQALPGLCQLPCRTFFTICMSHYQAHPMMDPPQCTRGTHTTPVLANNTMTDPIPINFHFNFTWPGSCSLIFEAWHDVTGDGPSTGSPRLLLIRFTVQRSSLDVSTNWTSEGHVMNTSHVTYRYRVVCDTGFYGDGCNVMCRSRDDRWGHYRCDEEGNKICREGWRGEFCDQAVCLTGCNPERGVCNVPGECRCRPGWHGSLCDQCIKYPGCCHGNCTLPWQCNCYDGWGGLFCNEDQNFCTHHRPCQNGATCLNTGRGSYSCLCTPEYSGTNCELEVSDCRRQPCYNGGTCREFGSEYTCQCAQGYHGKRCQSSARSCDESPCKNLGHCVSRPTGYTCHCLPGYTGYDCELDIDECLSLPCVNGGRCINSAGGFICACPAGFTGQRCDLDLDDCVLDPTCLNGGECIDGVNEFTCRCPAGFKGSLCQDAVDCSDSPCLNNASCLNRDTGFDCLCVSGTYGTNCEHFNLFSFSPDLNLLNNTENVTSEISTNDSGDIFIRQIVLVVCLGAGLPLLLVIIVAAAIFVYRRHRADRENIENETKMNNAKKISDATSNLADGAMRKNKIHFIDKNKFDYLAPSHNTVKDGLNSERSKNMDKMLILQKSRDNLLADLDKHRVDSKQLAGSIETESEFVNAIRRHAIQQRWPPSEEFSTSSRSESSRWRPNDERPSSVYYIDTSSSETKGVQVVIATEV